jgi:hypothetical protein
MKKPIYVSREVINHEEIAKWFTDQGIEEFNSATMHTTVAYSTNPVEWDAIEPVESHHSIIFGKREMHKFGDDDSVLVLGFESNTLKLEWEHLKSLGCSWDYPEYNSHITIVYGTDLPVDDIKPYLGMITLGPQVMAELNTNWED